MIFKEGFLSFYCFNERHPLSDFLLTPALDNHVALLQLDDFVVDYFDHCVFCAFIHQVRLGQDAWERDKVDYYEFSYLKSCVTSAQKPIYSPRVLSPSGSTC